MRFGVVDISVNQTVLLLLPLYYTFTEIRTNPVHAHMPYVPEKYLLRGMGIILWKRLYNGVIRKIVTYLTEYSRK